MQCTFVQLFQLEGLPVLKVSQVASHLSVGHQTVLDWITRGVKNPLGGYRQLRAVRSGRSWRVPSEALEDFLIKSENIEPLRTTTISRRLQKKIDAEVKEYWKVMSKKKKLK
jgi:excisionase family DNA binding protein